MELKKMGREKRQILRQMHKTQAGSLHQSNPKIIVLMILSLQLRGPNVKKRVLVVKNNCCSIKRNQAFSAKTMASNRTCIYNQNLLKKAETRSITPRVKWSKNLNKRYSKQRKNQMIILKNYFKTSAKASLHFPPSKNNPHSLKNRL